MGHHRRKHKHKHQNNNNENQPLHLGRADKTILGFIAILTSPLRSFESDIEKEISFLRAQNFRDVLHGKPRRVAECIMDKNKQENNRIRVAADELIKWANLLYEVKANPA